MENLKKSWKTSLLGVVILGYYIYNFIVNGIEIDFASIVPMLMGLGLLVAKDGNQSHSK